MQSFIQGVVENYIIFLFFAGLLLFSLIRSGSKSRRKARAVLILILFSAVIWVFYYLIYTSKLPENHAYIVPAALVVVVMLLRRNLFIFKTHCTRCSKALSITEFLSSDENLCRQCYEELHPESVKLTPEEERRREVEQKKKTWEDWKPKREFVIVFAADTEGNVLLIDNLGLGNVPGKLSGALGVLKKGEKKTCAASRALMDQTGLKCEEPDYMGRLNFEMMDNDIRFHVFVAREYSGELIGKAERKPVWQRLKKLKYDLMSMDYPLWLPRMVRGQSVEYYARCNAEGKIYDDILDLDVEI